MAGKKTGKPKGPKNERRIYVDDPLWERFRIAAIRMKISTSEFLRRGGKKMLEQVEGTKII